MTHPQTISKYQITGVLGQGAMGVVYKAQDLRIDRTVAIKTIHAGLMQGDLANELKTRFVREIRAVGNLRHPNIIAIYDTDEENGAPFYVMEFVEGRELSAYFKDNARFTTEQTLHIGRQLLSALAYTHHKNIIHRDIKPANIFLTGEGDVKVADFGIAKVENSELTQVGTSLGTPSYMSPEQCRGQPVDNRSDLFSIGIVLYQLFTGEKPFQASSTHALMHQILQSTPEKPSVLNPTLAPAVDRLFERALAKNPNDRFQNAEEFLDALEAALAGRTPAAAGGRGRFWLWWAGSAALVYAIGMAVYLAVAPNQADSVLAAKPEQEGISSADIGLSEIAPGNLNPEQQAKVDKFLKLAQLSIDGGRLVFPPTSNAVYVYRLILDIDPGNVQAREGLKRVLQMQIDKAQELEQAKDRDALEKHLDVSLQAFPNSKALQTLRGALNGPATATTP